MPGKKINLEKKFSEFSEYWSPRIVAELNDYQIKLVKLKGEFTWHDHQDTDEAFIVISGSMSIDLRDCRIELCEGEMFVVPKGVEHKPSAEEEVSVLTFEPSRALNTGNIDNDFTIKNLDRI